MSKFEKYSRGESEEKAKKIDLLLLDVDGVMTDGGVYLGGEDFEMKKFNTQDGLGIVMARRVGIESGIITGRVSDAVARRAKELEIDKIYQGQHWKIGALEEILEEYNSDQLAYMGDDLLDLPVLTRVGFPLAPANACPAVEDEALYVTDSSGGDGAIREAVDYLLDLRGDKEKLIKFYLNSGESSKSVF